MLLKFHIHYLTKPGETLFINVNNKKIAMLDVDSGWWFAEFTENNITALQYFYLIYDNYGNEIISEYKKNRKIALNKSAEVYNFHDIWFGANRYDPFHSNVFTKLVNKRKNEKHIIEHYKKTIEFQTYCPYISNKFSLAITGNNEILGLWTRPVKMQVDKFSIWKIAIDADKIQFPFEFKFVLTDNTTSKIVEWESGENRVFYTSFSSEYEYKIHVFETSIGKDNQWRGAGTAIPVFSLRTETSCGIGDFADLKLMIDWLEKTNQVLLQILPVNDCTAFFDYRDSCPYSAVSIYALNPAYINISAMGRLNLENQLKLEKTRTRLNNYAVVEYEKAIKAKWKFFKAIFNNDGAKCMKSAQYNHFIVKNSFWLKPYSMFCILRDKFKTPDFKQWKGYENFKTIDIADFEKQYAKSFQFYYFLQYHAHRQMHAASSYARKKGIILKGDIPIGIGRNSVETWTSPEYFNLETQAGAPPDDFSATGQNWSFPTYNWNLMSRDSYKWWICRLQKIAEYFDAYRIDHVLGFFRIWEIPFHSMQGLLGRFNPSLPYSMQELQQKGLETNLYPYTKPYINNSIIRKKFGNFADYVWNTFFEKATNNALSFKPQFDTQRKINSFFDSELKDNQTEFIKSGLFALINNVLLIEDETNKKHFYPRIAMQLSTAYKELDEDQKQIFDNIYNEFYYKRNIELWRLQAMKTLPVLIGATNMLACCEDLGMIPDCVPDTVRYLQLLSLEIQRMPKTPNIDFANPSTYPYLSVCTTSTHDTSTLRGWWKENRGKTDMFYNSVLKQNGSAPEVCPGQIAEKILTEHLKSPAMLAVFPWQDWMAIDENLRRKNDDEERINIPSNSDTCWQYRMHITLEKLLREDKFNEKIRQLAGLR